MLEAKYIQLFNQILDELWHYESKERNALADTAEVSRSMLYKWQIDPPISPQLRTFIAVAEAMGYEVRLVKQRGKKHLRKAA